jgi:hypothetical protein
MVMANDVEIASYFGAARGLRMFSRLAVSTARQIPISPLKNGRFIRISSTKIANCKLQFFVDLIGSSIDGNTA